MDNHTQQEIIKYAKGMEASSKILEWLEKHAFTQKGVQQQELEHILDYLVSGKAPKNLSKASYKQMKSNADKWVKAMNKKGEDIDEKPEDVEVIKKYKNGFKIVKLIGENVYKREAFLM